MLLYLFSSFNKKSVNKKRRICHVTKEVITQLRRSHVHQMGVCGTFVPHSTYLGIKWYKSFGTAALCVEGFQYSGAEQTQEFNAERPQKGRHTLVTLELLEYWISIKPAADSTSQKGG